MSVQYAKTGNTPPNRRSSSLSLTGAGGGQKPPNKSAPSSSESKTKNETEKSTMKADVENVKIPKNEINEKSENGFKNGHKSDQVKIPSQDNTEKKNVRGSPRNKEKPKDKDDKAENSKLLEETIPKKIDKEKSLSVEDGNKNIIEKDPGGDSIKTGEKKVEEKSSSLQDGRKKTIEKDAPGQIIKIDEKKVEEKSLSLQEGKKHVIEKDTRAQSVKNGGKKEGETAVEPPKKEQAKKEPKKPELTTPATETQQKIPQDKIVETSTTDVTKPCTTQKQVNDMESSIFEVDGEMKPGASSTPGKILKYHQGPMEFSGLPKLSTIKKDKTALNEESTNAFESLNSSLPPYRPGRISGRRSIRSINQQSLTDSQGHYLKMNMDNDWSIPSTNVTVGSEMSHFSAPSFSFFSRGKKRVNTSSSNVDQLDPPELSPKRARLDLSGLFGKIFGSPMTSLRAKFTRTKVNETTEHQEEVEKEDVLNVSGSIDEDITALEEDTSSIEEDTSSGEESVDSIIDKDTVDNPNQDNIEKGNESPEKTSQSTKRRTCIIM